MAAPIAGFIQLPTDTGNTGKKVRTQSRVVGADTVHEHFFIAERQRRVLGVYRCATAQLTVSATAQNGTTTGFLWFYVPSAVSNTKARIRRLYFSTQHSTVLATPTAPRLALSRFTWTGTPTGTQITQQKVDTTYPASVVEVRTTSAGWTVTLDTGQPVAAGGIVGALTAVGAYAPVDLNVIDLSEAEDEWLVVGPSEGLVLWQDTAGTTSDTRKLNPVVVWDEIDTA